MVGAGVAGLVCARRLSQVGLKVTVVDPQLTVGGRVQTDVVDGFRLDRGFQVYLTNYPACRVELDEGALDFRKFEPGCLVWDGKKQHEVHKDAMIQMFVDRWIPFSDMVKTVSMSMDLKEMSDQEIWGQEDQTIEAYLRGRGFSEKYLDRFVRPFFGGVLLDSSLKDSVLPFLYYWKMFEEGDTVIPARGMGEISQQIASGVPDDAWRMGQGVAEISREGGYVNGVKLADGSVIEAQAVVVATDSRTASQLTGLAGPKDFRVCTTVHFAADSSPVPDPVIVVNASGQGRVHHVAPMSKVSPALAPKGRHLVSATLLSNPVESDLNLAKSVQYELRDWFKQSNVAGWVPLAVHRVPLGQMAQPVGFRDHLMPKNPETGLFIAGEGTTYAGLDGAFRSGQDAATGILRWFKEPATV